MAGNPDSVSPARTKRTAKALLRLLAVPVVLSCGFLLATCGGSSGPAPPCTNCNPSSSDFVYQANANQVSIFQVDSSSGVLQGTPTPVAGAMIPGGIVATSTNFVYVTEAEGTGGLVYAYEVNTSTGDLMPVTGSPFNTGISEPAQGMAVDPAGKFLYITEPNVNQVAAYVIGANGALTAVAGSPFDTNDTRPTAATIDASGHYLYVSNQASLQGTVSAFSIDAGTGALTAIAGSPFPTAANGAPSLLATDPSGKYLYAPLSGGTAVFAFSIGATGALSPVAGSPFAVGSQPNSVIVDPAGKILYSADFKGSDVSALSLDAASGALTPVVGSPIAVPNNPFQVSMNSTGTLLFVGLANALNIAVFTVGNGGMLTAVAPLSGGQTAGGVVIIHKSS
jgi:6-phosphogluconolactonase (cycloisomerase 2 family)